MTQPIDYFAKYKKLMAESIARDKEIIEMRLELGKAREDLLMISEEYEKLNTALQEIGIYEKVVDHIKGIPFHTETVSKKPKIEDPDEVEAPKKEVKRSGDLLADKGELIAWTTLFKKLYPGSLSNLRNKQRENIVVAIEEYLKNNLGHEWKKCFQNIRNQPQICIPENMCEDFHQWFDSKVGEGILDGPNTLKKRTGSANNIPESARAIEICQNFIPGNEFATTLIEIAEEEFPNVVISFKKFTELIESYCPSPINKPLGVKVDREKIRQKFKQTFAEEIKGGKSATKKRTSEVTAPPSKKPKPDKINAHRYNSILREIMPSYNQSAYEKRVEMKKRVKQWLKENIANFKDCKVIIPNGENSQHQTYCIPDANVNDFTEWAKNELKSLALI